MKHVENLIKVSIQKIDEAKIDVYSYAIYFDHESKRRLSVCIDTKDNSLSSVTKSNKWKEKHFRRLLTADEGDSIVHFSMNSGRSYSLGDFAYVNIASYEYANDLEYSASYMLSAIKSVIAHQDEITKYSMSPDQVLFSCSTKDDEYGVSWFRITSPI